MNFLPDRTFRSAHDAFEFILERRALRPNQQRWEPEPSGLMIPHEIPQYIFRGENGSHPTTTGAISRLQQDRNWFSPADLEYLRHLMLGLHQGFKADGYSLDDHHATAVLQHYGLPTFMIDFTADLCCAFSFAAMGDSDEARIAVLPTRSAPLVDALADLRDHPWTERPRRQQAFGVAMPVSMPDLKSDAARSVLNVTWYEFPVRLSDREELAERHRQFLQIDGDPSAAFLRFHITEYVEECGKMSYALARWLLERIPIAPRCYRIVKFDNRQPVVHFRPPTDVAGFCVAKEREHSLAYWSEGAVSSRERRKGWSYPAVGSTAVDPRTYHADLYCAT